MFSAVRDGYYQAMRAQRISQRHKNVHQREMALKVDDGTPAPMATSVEKSQSANELSPGKKNAGTVFFKYMNELTVKEESVGANFTGSNCSLNNMNNNSMHNSHDGGGGGIGPDVNGTAGGKASSTKGGIWPLGKV
jgi:hypothetical protein